MWGYKLTSGTPVSIPATIVVDGKYIETLASGVTTLGVSYGSEQAEQEIEIIELQANATLTPIDHDSSFSETFSDANGYLNSVDTVNTTSTFVGGSIGYVGRLTIAHTQTPYASGDGHSKQGFFITPSTDCVLLGFNKHASCNATTGYLYDTIGPSQIYKTTGFTNFSTPQSLTGGTQYIICMDSDGLDFNRFHFHDSTPETTGIITWDDGCSTLGSSLLGYNILSVILAGTGTVVLDLPTITGTVTATQLLINGESSNGTTYELEDVGTNTDSGLSLNTKNDILTLTTNPTKLTLTCPAGDYVKSVVLKLWKS